MPTGASAPSPLLAGGGRVPGDGALPFLSRIPFGIALGGLVLAITILGIIYVLISLVGVYENPGPRSGLERYALPLLALAGLGVAAYLSYVELFHAEAFCGPIGGCNVVQTSRYARLFGVLPIGVLGAGGYLLILACSAAQQAWKQRLGRAARLAIFAGALFGTVFSAYLTCIEIFILHAVCIWCLSSAVLITLILTISARPAASSF